MHRRFWLLIVGFLLLILIIVIVWQRQRSPVATAVVNVINELNSLDRLTARTAEFDKELSARLSAGLLNQKKRMLDMDHAGADAVLAELHDAMLQASAPVPEEVRKAFLVALSTAHYVHFHGALDALRRGTRLSEAEIDVSLGARRVMRGAAQWRDVAARLENAELARRTGEAIEDLERRLLVGDLEGFNQRLGDALGDMLRPEFGATSEQQDLLYGAAGNLHRGTNEVLARADDIRSMVPACPEIPDQPIPPTPIKDSCCGTQLPVADNDPKGPSKLRCLFQSGSTCIATYEGGFRCEAGGSDSCQSAGPAAKPKQ